MECKHSVTFLLRWLDAVVASETVVSNKSKNESRDAVVPTSILFCKDDPKIGRLPLSSSSNSSVNFTNRPLVMRCTPGITPQWLQVAAVLGNAVNSFWKAERRCSKFFFLLLDVTTAKEGLRSS